MEADLNSCVCAYVRGRVSRELRDEVPVVVRANEEMGMVEVREGAEGKERTRSSLVDHVFDGSLEAERGPGDNYYDDDEVAPVMERIWDRVGGAVLDRLELEQEAAVVVLGSSKSGKSSCLIGGDDESPNSNESSPSTGLLPRFVREIFDDQFAGDMTADAIELSMMQVVDEECVDLLKPSLSKAKRRLNLRWSTSCGAFVQDVSYSLCRSPAEVGECTRR